MRQISTKADRIGFGLFIVLAVTMVALISTHDGADLTVASQSLTTAIQAPATTPDPVPTTAPIAMPAAQPAIGGEDIDEDAAESDPPLGLTDSNELGAQGDVPAADEADSTDADEPGAVIPDPDEDAPVEQAATSSAADTGASTETATQAATASSGVNPQPAATAVPNPQPPAATAVPNPQPPAATAVPNPQTANATAPISAPADAPAGGTFTHTLTAAVSRPTLHSSPGGSEFMPTFNGTALPPVNPTVFGNALVYRVLAGAPGDAWAKVYVPARPNGTTAWVQTSQFNWGSSNRMLQINVANNTVTVFEGSQTLLTTSAVTGTSSSPTPLASGWVEEIMAGPSAAYGTKLISLGMFSEALNSFGGGIPKIALHGTNAPGLMGQYASNGCIRVRNEIIDQIATMLPVGSKVIIVG